MPSERDFAFRMEDDGSHRRRSILSGVYERALRLIRASLYIAGEGDRQRPMRGLGAVVFSMEATVEIVGLAMVSEGSPEGDSDGSGTTPAVVPA